MRSTSLREVTPEARTLPLGSARRARTELRFLRKKRTMERRRDGACMADLVRWCTVSVRGLEAGSRDVDVDWRVGEGTTW